MTCDEYVRVEDERWPGCVGCGLAHDPTSRQPALIICRPSYKTFWARVRLPYERKYQVVGKSRSRSKAYRLLAEAMETGRYKRGDVLAEEGPESYYEPSLLVEMVRSW